MIKVMEVMEPPQFYVKHCSNVSDELTQGNSMRTSMLVHQINISRPANTVVSV